MATLISYYNSGKDTERYLGRKKCRCKLVITNVNVYTKKEWKIAGESL
jgi:hypothetical protein